MPSDVIKEAIADVNNLKEGATEVATKILSQHFNKNLKKLVESQLNEEEDCDMEENEDELDENMVGGQDHLNMDFPYTEGLEDLDLGGDEDEDEEGMDAEEDDLELEEGYGQEELEEALRLALQEVENPPLGDMEVVAPHQGDPDGKPSDNRGLARKSKKEQPWEEAPLDKDSTPEIHGGGSYHENANSKVAKVVAENMSLKKQVKQRDFVIKKLREAIQESKLFNAKILYTHRLLKNESLNSKMRLKVVERMDKAKSLNEAKNIFETMQEAFSLMGDSKAKSAKRSLSETLGSGVVESRGVSEDLLVESSNSSFSKDRMAFLAGIKKED